MIEIKKGWRITEEEHVKQFLTYMYSILGNSFHPDDDLLSHINFETEEPTLSVEDAKYLNECIDKCFELSGEGVYDISLEIMETLQEINAHMKDMGFIGTYFPIHSRHIEDIKTIKEIIDDMPKYTVGKHPKKIKVYRRSEVRTEPKVGRNQRCKCGSGLKFKNCCLKK